MASETFLERAARWASDLRWRDVPPPVRRAAAAQRLSAVGAAAWTCSLPVGDHVLRTVAEELPEGEGATLLGTGSVHSRAAAYGHAALGMALDFDDTVLGGHTGHSAVFVPLAYAEASGASWRRALLGHVAANEVAARVASAAAVGPFRGQQTAYVHALCAAVGRGVAEGDDPETLADAMAIALGQPPWPLSASFLGSDAKVLSAAEPVLSGLSAVTAARSGLEGRHDVVEADEGFLAEFADYPLPEFLDDLGSEDPDGGGGGGFLARRREREQRWHTRAITVKQYPGCAYVSAPVQAALEARRELPSGTAEVSHVDVDASLFTTRVDELTGEYVRGPDSTLSALNFSVPYNVAVALLDGEHTPRQFHPRRIGSRDVWELAERVRLRHDAEYTMDALRSEVPLGAMLRRVGPLVLPYSARTVGVGTTLKNLPTLLRFVRKRPLPTDLSGAEKRLGARVTVHLTDGRSVSADCPHPTGFAGRPLPEIRAVARRKCADALGERAGSGVAVRPVVDALAEPEGRATLAAVDSVLRGREAPTP